MIGKTVSHYQIVEKLGSGGMGVVWKARDTRLNRVVALKMLPPAYHDNPERRQRFLHEAQAASALSHPHIVTVYDIVEQDGAEFIVMEYVAGKALDALIPRKGMRLAEALRIAVQAADALSAAHRAGIIHRDLKPGNVMVAENGAVKVLDFGLAKTEEKPAAGEDDATRTVAPKTADGLVVGTMGYMSPEQAEAKPVDARSDIFSFGAMLYEMVTGERAFRGDTNLSTMAAILHKDPAALAPDIPAELQRVIARCLRKDPRRRFQHMDDLMVALDELREESESGTLAAAPAAIATTARSSRTWIAVAAAAIVVVAGAAWWLTHRTAPKPVTTATEIPLTTDPGVATSPSFSPDGNQVAYSWNGESQDNYDIYVKLIGAPTPLRLTTDPAPDVAPAFSPDGRSIGFIRVGKEHNQLIAIPPIGGPERVVAELPAAKLHFSWLPDGRAVIVDGLTVLSMDSGEMRSLAPPANVPGRMPAVAPDGHAVAFVRGVSTGGDVYVLGLSEDGKAMGGVQRLTTSNHQIFGIAWAAGSAALVVGSGQLSSPPDLWRIALSSLGQPQLLPFGRIGGATVATAKTGNRLAYSRVVSVINLWRLPLAAAGTAGGTPAKFFPSTRHEFDSSYSPDGKRVVFSSSRSGKSGLWVGDADGSKAAELYLPPDGHAGSPAWSPDGQTIAFDCNESGRFQLYAIRAAGGKPRRLTPLTDDPAAENVPNWSRDGKWIYFFSNRSGRSEVWKAPSSGGRAVRVTQNGGQMAKESPDGQFLYYVKGDTNSGLWRMPTEGGEESLVLPSVSSRRFDLGSQGIYFVPAAGGDGKYTLDYAPYDGGKPKTILKLPHSPSLGLSLSPDGRFLLYSQVEQNSEELTLVENYR